MYLWLEDVAHLTSESEPKCRQPKRLPNRLPAEVQAWLPEAHWTRPNEDVDCWTAWHGTKRCPDQERVMIATLHDGTGWLLWKGTGTDPGQYWLCRA